MYSLRTTFSWFIQISEKGKLMFESGYTNWYYVFAHDGFGRMIQIDSDPVLSGRLQRVYQREIDRGKYPDVFIIQLIKEYNRAPD